MLILERRCCGVAGLVVDDVPGPLAAFGLECFGEGQFIDEGVAAGVAQ
jgi:hypothetical protein